MSVFPTFIHEADLAIVGGGLSGLCAAVSAARHGARVCLMQDRPVLGGNASGEIRMWICGAQGRDMKETGLVEELELENMYRNPERNYSVWENVMYELAMGEENLELILNCSCQKGEMEGDRLLSVTGWQTTTQQYHTVRAKIFADCSGDSVLAPITGARFRVGREARGEFGESIAPAEADRKTMGMSCLLQARQEDTPSDFIPPSRAFRYTAEDLPYRLPNMEHPAENFWYLELGGEDDSIADTERLRDELIRMAYGIWDFVKNAPENREKNRNWHLDWVGMLPGKRESRRYEGAYMMTQNDVQKGGPFPDTVAYGGWPMDDHDPAGFRTREAPNKNHLVPPCYGIPYRCLYSANIANLMFAGRNISVTHSAMSSTRVMATCATLGQAVGTAAAQAVQKGCLPRDVDVDELQQQLLYDDCFLPGIRRRLSEKTRSARLYPAEAEIIRSGRERNGENDLQSYQAPMDQPIALEWDREISVEKIRLVLDSDLNRETQPEETQVLRRGMMCNRLFHWPNARVSQTLLKDFDVQACVQGEWIPVCRVENCHKRQIVIPVGQKAKGIRIIPRQTWGCETGGIFALDVD